MLPAFTAHNHTNVISIGCELFGDLSVGNAISRHLSHCANNRFRQYRIGIGFAQTSSCHMSPLAYHIVCVVLMCAKKQVIWVYARGVVAFMANKHAFWNWPVVKLIGKAMHQHIAHGRNVQTGIAEFVSRGLPIPALILIAALNRTPEALFGWQAVLVAWTKQFRLAFDMSPTGIVSRRDLGSFAATTMAKAIGDFWGGIVRGMIVHSKFSLLELAHATGRLQRRGGNLIGCYRSIIAQMYGAEKRVSVIDALTNLNS